MAIALSALTTRLAAEVPASGGTPSSTQYENAVKDAVHDFNGYVGRKKLHQFQTVSGQADYTLPDDFDRVIHLEDKYHEGVVHGRVIINESGIIPMSEAVREEIYTVAGNTLTLIPTPTGGLNRFLWYRAVHVLNGSDEYPDMGDAEASIIMQKAIANAWRIVASKAASSSGWSYKAGDVSINKANAGTAMESWIQEFDREYLRRVDRYVGHVGGLA